jgi:hypothetical protein
VLIRNPLDRRSEVFDGVIGNPRRLTLALALVAGLGTAGHGRAGPPYLSDDPEPTDTGHWEIYNFATGAGAPGGLAGEAGFDINYGAARDLQLTAVLPLAFENSNGFRANGLRGGPGDVELAVKYRFLRQADDSWTPDVAVFPRLFAPTAPRTLGTGEFGLFLPVWAEKDFGPWSVFGGGGYQINPGAGQRDFWQGGLAISRDVSKRLSLGAEVYGQAREADDGGAYQTVNFAAVYKLVKHWSLLASAGPAWSQGSLNGYVFYFALKADY